MEEAKCPACQGVLQYIPPKTEDNIVAWIMLVSGAFFAPVLIGIVFIILAVSTGFTKKVGDVFVCPSCGGGFTREELHRYREEAKVLAGLSAEERDKRLALQAEKRERAREEREQANAEAAYRARESNRIAIIVITSVVGGIVIVSLLCFLFGAIGLCCLFGTIGSFVG